MSKILQADDICVDMALTVLRGGLTPSGAFGAGGFREDKRFNGRVLKVKSVDLPYVLVEFFSSSIVDDKSGKVLDIREVILGSLSSEYVQEYEPRLEVVSHGVSPNWSYEGWKKQPVFEKK